MTTYRARLQFAAILFLALVFPLDIHAASGGTFVGVGDMSRGRVDHGLALLPDGKVLIAGGVSDQVYQTSAEIYDPVARTFTATGDMLEAREFCDFNTPISLATGKVFLTGGRNYPAILASAELYDPASGTFSQTGSMSVERWCPTVTLLPSGKVLVAGGSDQNLTYLDSAEIYDPATGTFSPTSGKMTTPRGFAMATLLLSGQVLIMGGVNATTPLLNTAELFDPASGTFTPTDSTPSPVASEGMALLANGKVLVTGFKNNTPAQLYNPGSGTFSETGPERFIVSGSPDVALLNGNLVNVGPSGHLYVTSIGQFLDGPKMIGVRSAAILLKDGTVFLCGGISGPNIYARRAGLYISK
jgi:hypothetical protein